MGDNVVGEIKFGNTSIRVQNEVVAKVTKWSKGVSIDEEDITGSEDVIAGTNVVHKQFTPVAVGETAEMEGISIEDADTGRDDGQSELYDAATQGQIVTVRHVKNTGYGDLLTGFFTAYDENASTAETYKWKGSFRVNTITPIVPGS